MSSRRLDILRDRVGEPGTIVGNPGANALAGMRQPPMLHVALDELPRRRAKQVLARQIGPGGGERHAVLQLIAKAIGAAGLIEGGARPDAAGERLIEQPAVEHDVHRPVGSLDLNRAQGLVPEARDRCFEGVEIGGAIALDRRARLLARGRVAEEEDDFGHAARRNSNFARIAAQGSKPAPTLLDSGVALVSAAGLASVPLRPMNSRRSPVHSVCAPRMSAKAMRDPNDVFQGLRAKIAPVFASFSVSTKASEADRDAPSTHST